MAVILKNGAVFLHIPKTGGNWITHVLEELDLIKGHIAHKHADMDHFVLAPKPRNRAAIIYSAIKELVYFRKNAAKPFMFCFVRNPLAWYESWYRYMLQPSRQWRSWGDERSIRKWHPNAPLNGLGSDDFNDFIRKVIFKRPGYVSEMYSGYATSLIDYVGKQENLVEDFIKVLRIMNVNFDEGFVRGFGEIGTSPKTENDIVWQNDLKRQVALLEYAGMIRYGYHSTLRELGIEVDRLLCGS